MNTKQFYRLSQLVGEEIREQNTNYRRAIPPEERLANFFEVRAIKICRRQERDSRYIFLISAVLDSNMIYSYSSSYIAVYVFLFN
jgi:hypothetical protein